MKKKVNNYEDQFPTNQMLKNKIKRKKINSKKGSKKNQSQPELILLMTLIISSKLAL
jgi:hypothetical protein